MRKTYSLKNEDLKIEEKDQNLDLDDYPNRTFRLKIKPQLVVWEILVFVMIEFQIFFDDIVRPLSMNYFEQYFHIVSDWADRSTFVGHVLMDYYAYRYAYPYEPVTIIFRMNNSIIRFLKIKITFRFPLVVNARPQT